MVKIEKEIYTFSGDVFDNFLKPNITKTISDLYAKRYRMKMDRKQKCIIMKECIESVIDK